MYQISCSLHQKLTVEVAKISKDFNLSPQWSFILKNPTNKYFTQSNYEDNCNLTYPSIRHPIRSKSFLKNFFMKNTFWSLIQKRFKISKNGARTLFLYLEGGHNAFYRIFVSYMVSQREQKILTLSFRDNILYVPHIAPNVSLCPNI